MWRNQVICALLMGMENDTAAAETVWKFLKILKISYDLAIALLSIYPKEMKTGLQNVIFTPIIIHSS